MQPYNASGKMLTSKNIINNNNNNNKNKQTNNKSDNGDNKIDNDNDNSNSNNEHAVEEGQRAAAAATGNGERPQQGQQGQQEFITALNLAHNDGRTRVMLAQQRTHAQPQEQRGQRRTPKGRATLYSVVPTTDNSRHSEFRQPTNGGCSDANNSNEKRMRNANSNHNVIGDDYHVAEAQHNLEYAEFLNDNDTAATVAYEVDVENDVPDADADDDVEDDVEDEVDDDDDDEDEDPEHDQDDDDVDYVDDDDDDDEDEEEVDMDVDMDFEVKVKKSTTAQQMPAGAMVTLEHHARRPMNAFLIFCKRHRAIVKARYKSYENRAITKILGDWWASLEAKEKQPFTDLAQQNKSAFFNANPNFKWYKLPAPKLRTLTTRPNNATATPTPMQQHHLSPTTTSTSCNARHCFKFADERHMGESLNSLMDSTKSSISKRTAIAIEISKPSSKLNVQQQQQQLATATHSQTSTSKSVKVGANVDVTNAAAVAASASVVVAGVTSPKRAKLTTATTIATNNFDLEARLNQLPQLNLDEYLQRKRCTRKKKKSPYGKKRTNNSQQQQQQQQLQQQQQQQLQLQQQKFSQQQHKPTASRQPQTASVAAAVVGSQKRKARKSEITHNLCASNIRLVEPATLETPPNSTTASSTLPSPNAFQTQPSAAAATLSTSSAAAAAATSATAATTAYAAAVDLSAAATTSPLLILAEVAIQSTEIIQTKK